MTLNTNNSSFYALFCILSQKKSLLIISTKKQLRQKKQIGEIDNKLKEKISRKLKIVEKIGHYQNITLKTSIVIVDMLTSNMYMKLYVKTLKK